MRKATLSLSGALLLLDHDLEAHGGGGARLPELRAVRAVVGADGTEQLGREAEGSSKRELVRSLVHLARRDSCVVRHLAQAAVVARGGQPPYHLGDVISKHLSAGAPALRLEVHLEGELPQPPRAAVSLRVLFAVRFARLTMIRKISETATVHSHIE